MLNNYVAGLLKLILVLLLFRAAVALAATSLRSVGGMHLSPFILLIVIGTFLVGLAARLRRPAPKRGAQARNTRQVARRIAEDVPPARLPVVVEDADPFLTFGRDPR